MSTSARRPVLLGAAAAALLLLLAAPRPVEALSQLRDAGGARDPYEPLVAALSLAAWALTAWIVVTALLTVAGRLPGVAGRVSAAVSRRIAPAAVRRAVEVTLGLTVAVGVLGASPAAAATAPDTAAGPPSTAVSLDWAAAPATDLDWPTSTPTDVPVSEPIVVQPGDTLWGLAERSLRSAGDAAPTDAEIAQEWPAWWSANREAVGDDPDLLQPGTPLHPPQTPEGPGTAGPASR